MRTKKINANLFHFSLRIFCLQLTGAADSLNVCGLQWLVEDHDAAQLALKGGGASPLTVLRAG